MLSEREFLLKARDLYYLTIAEEDKKTISRACFIKACSKLSNYDEVEHPRIINYLLDNYVIDDASFIPFINIYNNLNTSVSKHGISKLLSVVFYNAKKRQHLIDGKLYKGLYLRKIK